MNSGLDELKFNDNIELIKTLSTADVAKKAFTIKLATQQYVQELSPINQELQDQIELKMVYEQRTNSNLNLISQSDQSYAEMRKSLFDLTESHNKISLFNSNVYLVFDRFLC